MSTQAERRRFSRLGSGASSSKPAGQSHFGRSETTQLTHPTHGQSRPERRIVTTRGYRRQRFIDGFATSTWRTVGCHRESERQPRRLLSSSTLIQQEPHRCLESRGEYRLTERNAANPWPRSFATGPDDPGSGRLRSAPRGRPRAYVCRTTRRRIAGSKERTILACLIARTGRVVPVDDLIEEP